MTTYKIDAINQWELGSTVAKCKEAITPLKNKNMFTLIIANFKIWCFRLPTTL